VKRKKSLEALSDLKESIKELETLIINKKFEDASIEANLNTSELLELLIRELDEIE